MNFSIEHAFSFVLAQRGWFLKLFVGALLLIFPTLLDAAFVFISPPSYVLTYFHSFLGLFDFVLIPFFLIFAFLFLGIGSFLAITGYIMHAMHRQVVSSVELLPDWGSEFFVYIWNGFKVLFGLWLWIIITVGTFALSFAFWFLRVLAPNFAEIFNIAAYLPGHPMLLVKMIALLFAVLGCYFVFLIPALIISFAFDLRFFSVFNLFRAQSIINQGPGSYIIAYMTIFLLKIIVALIIVILSLSVFGLLLVPFVAFYFMLVISNMLSQLGEAEFQPELST